MAGHQTMSGQDDYLSKQSLDLEVILTSALPLLSALKQNRAQSRLLYLFYDKDFNNFPTHSLTIFIFQRSKSGVSHVRISDKAR